mmetsp:Transcript_100345/g.312703  ORF Transcript_100345/g.312703 Transcript_100345/m.312703 type:complete len:543 (+) Transcript_100345:466-2094(+)
MQGGIDHIGKQCKANGSSQGTKEDQEQQEQAYCLATALERARRCPRAGRAKLGTDHLDPEDARIRQVLVGHLDLGGSELGISPCILGPMRELVQVQVDLVHAPALDAHLLHGHQHAQGGGQADRRVGLRVLQVGPRIAQDVAGPLVDTICGQPPCEPRALRRLQVVESPEESVSASVVARRTEAEQPGDGVVLRRGEARQGLGPLQQQEGVVCRSGLQCPQLLQGIEARAEPQELGLRHEERAREALGTELPTHLDKYAEAEESEAVLPMGLELVLHHHEVCRHVLRLQELAELKVDAQRIHNQALVVRRQAHERGHHLGLVLQDMRQGDVVHLGVVAGSQLFTEFLDLPQRVDRHEGQHGIQGLLVVHSDAFSHPVLYPRPGLPRQLLILRLAADEVVVLVGHEPQDGEQGSEGLQPLDLGVDVEVGQLREDAAQPGLELLLGELPLEHVRRQLPALRAQRVQHHLVVLVDRDPELWDHHRLVIGLALQLERQVLECHRPAEVLGERSQLLQLDDQNRPAASDELPCHSPVDLQQNTQSGA